MACDEKIISEELSMKKSHLLSAACSCALVLITNTVSAVALPLESRLGGLAYYDPNLNITWAADAGIIPFGNLDTQLTAAASLTIAGITNWRLPSMDVNSDGVVIDCNGGGVLGCLDNELGYLYWEEGITASTPGPFSNISGTAGVFYRSATELVSDSTVTHSISFGFGGQGTVPKSSVAATMAVYDGDVGMVPIPAAAWLFGTGLLGLIGVARHKKA